MHPRELHPPFPEKVPKPVHGLLLDTVSLHLTVLVQMCIILQLIVFKLNCLLCTVIRALLEKSTVVITTDQHVKDSLKYYYVYK